MEQVEAEYFQGFQKTGRTSPARVTCRKANGQPVEVFVKFAATVRDHHFGLCAEALCSTFARHLGLLTPEPFIVNLSPEFLEGAPAHGKDLISRSLGLNFGTTIVGEGYAVMPTEPHLPKELKKLAAEIFAFDVLIQNLDRKGDNPNLLWNQKSIVLIDHERALTPILDWQTLNIVNLDLDRFYDHVFYPSISPHDADYEGLINKIQQMTPAVLDGFFEQLPPVWRNENALSAIRDYLNFVVANDEAICDIIHARIS